MKSGTTTTKYRNLLKIVTDITKWGSYYKVGQYINQRYMKKLVRITDCSPSIALICYLVQGKMEKRVYK